MGPRFGEFRSCSCLTLLSGVACKFSQPWPTLLTIIRNKGNFLLPEEEKSNTCHPTSTALYTRRGATVPSQPATLSLLIHGETIRAGEAMIDADFLRRKRGRRAATEERARTTDGRRDGVVLLSWLATERRGGSSRRRLPFGKSGTITPVRPSLPACEGAWRHCGSPW